MRGKIRRVWVWSLQHVYQKSFDDGVIFYNVFDSLVFYTIFSVTAAKFGIVTLGLCLMPNHIHYLVFVKDKETFSSFVRELSKAFVNAYNKECPRTGSLFKRPFGSSSKTGGKQIRTSIAYVYNNPVEKKLCDSAQDYRWNFLAYANNTNPFSEPKALRNESYTFKKYASSVRMLHSNDRPLSYTFLKDLFKNLNADEWQRFVDYLIRIYNPIDFEKAISYFGRYDKMLTALNSNTGSEYEIKEEYNPDSDAVYRDIHRELRTMCPNMHLKSVYSLPLDEKKRLAAVLLRNTAAKRYQVARYLHIEDEGMDK